MGDDLKKFDALVEGNPELKKRVGAAWVKMEKACDPARKEYANTLVAIGKEQGLDFSEEDVAATMLAEASGELDESQLDKVAGGASYSTSSFSTISPTYSTSTLNLESSYLKDPSLTSGVT